MENASKALVMAGAILISIIVISIAIWVFNKWKITVVEKSNLDTEEIQAFNSKFTQFIGSNVSGQDVNSLIQAVVTTNISSTSSGDYEKRLIITFPNTEGGTTTVDEEGNYSTTTGRKVKTGGAFYEVKITESSGGLIKKIEVSQDTT